MRGGIEAVRKMVTDNQNYTGPPCEFLLSLLRFILYKNYFKFEKQYFLQRTRTAMGSKVAPAYANSYMHVYENECILSHPAFRQYGAFYRRYIDDIFYIWSGPTIELEKMVDQLNTMETPIRFTLKYNTSSMEFLDVRIYKGETKLETCIYVKPTDRNTLLHYQSCHPRHLLESLPKSQMLRVIRITSEEYKRVEDLELMSKRFLERGYPTKLIEDTKKWALSLNQDESGALQNVANIPSGAKQQQKNAMYYVSKYGEGSDHMRKCVLKHRPLVASDERVSKKLPPKPRFSYQRGKSLKDILSPSDPVDKYIGSPVQHFLSQRPGVFKCNGCVMCSSLILGSHFLHPRTGKKYEIKQRMTCTTTMVVYIIKCPCGLIYCGKTIRMLKERIGMHRASIRAALDPDREEKAKNKKQDISQQLVAKHWAEAKHSPAAFRCMPIEKVPVRTRGGDSDNALLRKEAFWIHELDCVSPKGLNGQLVLSCFLT
ncbi:uncharacterized protein LOC108719286 isoform X1 [Xenopus laevis]|uniref:Uncharacterized protein LOC108719286 isoform X1 n=1 Tax=Xenopus laevis TaxID=8355 RepID=A0A8J1L1G1_XENLA|nr:uncharacterized protein LOC108719286 isoform X1 [Xenopus laevis]